MKNYFSLRLIAAVATGLMVGAVAYTQQKPCATASQFGLNDQIGNVNYITAEKTLAATKLVTKGKAYRLGIETNKDIPAFPPRTFSIVVLQPNQAAGSTLGATKTTYNDDIIMGWVGVGTGIDGLGHVGIDNVYFNCNKAADFVAPNGLKNWASRIYRRSPHAECCLIWQDISTPTSSRKARHSTAPKSKAR